MSGTDDVAERCARILIAIDGTGDVDAAIAELHALPADLTGRGALAAGLIVALLRTGSRVGAPEPLRHLDGLLAIAEHDPPPTAEWPRQRAVGKAMALLRAAAERELTDPRAALKELDDLATDVGDDPAAMALMDYARSAMRLLQGVRDDDEGAVRRVMDDMRRLSSTGPLAGHSAIGPTADVLSSTLAAMAAHQRGEDISDALDSMTQLAQALPADDHLRAVTAEAVASMGLLRGLLGDSEEPADRLTDEQLADLAAKAHQPELGDAARALYHAQAGAALLGHGGQETDLGRVEAAIEHLQAAVRLTAGDHPERAFHLVGLALARYRRAELTNAIEDLDAAAGVVAEARELAGGPQHPLWPTISELLSYVHARRGDAPAPHKTALEGLRGHVWKVLLQPDLAAANIATRSAARDAVDVARQCLAAGDPGSAIGALDAGRGLALFAATEVGNVVSRLTDAGKLELVQRWQAAAASGRPEDLPADLRRDVLTALTAQNSAAALLDPPSLEEIQDALATVDADALVYLVPGEGQLAGFAVIAPAHGAPKYLALPSLQVEDQPDLDRYLTILARRDAAPPDPVRDITPRVADSDFQRVLDTLCDWAWRAAIGPLVDSYLATVPRAASGRPPRMILVPMGQLARVPWQAARRQDGEYALNLAAISQTASARMLCHSAGLAPVPVTPVGLIVGDPDAGAQVQDLTAARIEAHAIFRSFYLGARYVGRRIDNSTSRSGTGTADEVRGWLSADHPGSGAMLHLACHGVIEAESDATTSYLLLAGGGRLTAEELVALMARAPERAIALVVLAGCRTGLSINGYDEAYSLGTAFLAGGVRSVLSTQWNILDRATSVLMYMFHRHLMIHRLPAWEALRQAQIWMIDPARAVPKGMPQPLREHVAAADPAGVIGWAGFIHWGQ